MIQPSPATIPIAIVGIGKIARDQHIPTIAANPRFELAATVTRTSIPDEGPNFTSIGAMAAAMPEVRAVSICTPPDGRLDLVREALAAGLDVMLEKPPAGTPSEAEAIVAAAAASGRVLYLTWHSREAAGVEPARAWLAKRTIRHVAVDWREDVRHWHPGQEWIWRPGLGVFDPGINALSVLSHILPGPLLLDGARLRVPANKPAPIAATLMLRTGTGAPVDIDFDIDHAGEQVWNIRVDTDGGSLRLVEGASRLLIDDAPVPVSDRTEYARLYDRFAIMVDTRVSDTDLTPFRLVADATLIGERELVAPFSWDV